MNLSLKFLILFLFCLFIGKCFADDTPVEQDPSNENQAPTDQNTTPSKNDDIEPTDCDNLKLVLHDYSSFDSAVSWKDHTMDCCDGNKYVCQDIQGKKYITE
eukprot:jgi/Orpsp1_1/1185899/evm.model.c7180000095909.1